MLVMPAIDKFQPRLFALLFVRYFICRVASDHKSENRLICFDNVDVVKMMITLYSVHMLRRLSFVNFVDIKWQKLAITINK